LIGRSSIVKEPSAEVLPERLNLELIQAFDTLYEEHDTFHYSLKQLFDTIGRLSLAFKVVK
jgi:hypothetical protein